MIVAATGALVKGREEVWNGHGRKFGSGAGLEMQHEAAIRVIIHALCRPLVLRALFGTIFARS
jgi:hypothetical protein